MPGSVLRNSVASGAAGSAGNGLPAAAVYRSLQGHFYKAKVLARRPCGRLDIEVDCMGSTLMLTRIEQAVQREACEKGQCYLGVISGDVPPSASPPSERRP